VSTRPGQRGDRAGVVDALETVMTTNFAQGQVGAHPHIVDALDARLGVAGVGLDRALASRCS